MCMDVVVNMDVMMAVLLLHCGLLNMLLLVHGRKYLGVMIFMDVMVAVLAVRNLRMGSFFLHQLDWGI